MQLWGIPVSLDYEPHYSLQGSPGPHISQPWSGVRAGLLLSTLLWSVELYQQACQGGPCTQLVRGDLPLDFTSHLHLIAFRSWGWAW